MSEAPPVIDELVTRFADNSEQYRADDYKEARVRTEFIDPFFEALGWDVANRRGYAEAYKDVIREDALKIGVATKAPDYCFRTGGTRKFFVEAKKPALYLYSNLQAPFQLRRYAWSAKLPLSILTNFDEFAAYDCRIRPQNTDPSATARVLYVKYTEYATRWQEIASIFSHDAVLRGSFDRFADSIKGKRGTAEVDDAFLDEMETWRAWLAHDIAVHNSRLSQAELNFAVQVTINRIVFLRICEDRGIEPYQRLLMLQAQKPVCQHLLAYFRQADDRYNSGLFHFRKERGRPAAPDELTPRLTISDKALKRIISNLYYPDSPYEFSVLPADILGQVYEQFLGKVLRLTAGHDAKVDEKPEVKKAGGVYYTPTFVVDYIVERTVGVLLKGQTPRQVAALRILDPACGSGSFLVAAYQHLLDWHREYYEKDGCERHRQEVYQGPGGGWRLTARERKRILLNNIYGVDIDAQAVEVTKLSLLLKVLEGENEQSIGTSLRLFHERALPDLASNIKCGNSLIGLDFYRARELSEEERSGVNAFDWSEQFSDVMQAGGFDAVVGNPPYGAYLRGSEKRYLTENYVCQTYQLDSYLLFLERAVRYLLRTSGLLGMIIPNPWLTNLLQGNVRRFITDNTQITEIVHFKFPIFPATVDTEIVILQASAPRDDAPGVHVAIADSLESFRGIGDRQMLTIVHEQQKWQKLNGGVINIFLSSAEEALARKLAASGTPLGQLYAVNVGIKPYQAKKGHPPQTTGTVQKRPFDSDHRVNDLYRPCLRGGDIVRYLIAPTEVRFLKYGPWLAEPRPAINFDAPIKIVMRQTGDCLIAALDTERRLCLNNMHVVVPRDSSPDPLYALGIINSELMNWYYRTLNPEAGEALAEVKKTNVAALPIKEPPSRDRERIVNTVHRMLDLQARLNDARTPAGRENLERQIKAVDHEINNLVCALYELSDDERRIVMAALAS